MRDAGSWFVVALAFVVLPALANPVTRRALVRVGQHVSEWSRTRAERRSQPDTEQEKLWLWSKRRRLCTALDRIEHLLATDSWMSATRQLGNRLAYDQLVAELRRTPDVFPSSLDVPVLDLWSEPLPARRGRARAHVHRDDELPEIDWSSALPVGCTSGGGGVEVLEIGWRRR